MPIQHGSYLYLCGGSLQVANIDLRSRVQCREYGFTPLGEFDQGLVELLHQREMALKLFDPVRQNITTVSQTSKGS